MYYEINHPPVYAPAEMAPAPTKPISKVLSLILPPSLGIGYQAFIVCSKDSAPCREQQQRRVEVEQAQPTKQTSSSDDLLAVINPRRQKC